MSREKSCMDFVASMNHKFIELMRAGDVIEERSKGRPKVNNHDVDFEKFRERAEAGEYLRTLAKDAGTTVAKFTHYAWTRGWLVPKFETNKNRRQMHERCLEAQRLADGGMMKTEACDVTDLNYRTFMEWQARQRAINYE